MTEQQKQAIIESEKQYFHSIIKLSYFDCLSDLPLDSLDFDPYFINYLSTSTKEDSQFVELAKAIVYPEVFDRVFNFSADNKIQTLVSLLQDFTLGASRFDGIDFEFIDAIDGRHKYCQCMAGPGTSDDDDDIIPTLKKFKVVMTQPSLDVQFDDIVVGFLFGKLEHLPMPYMELRGYYSVSCGADFWLHLTGDKGFYIRMLKALGEVLDEGDFEGSELVQAKVKEFAEEIKQRV